MNAIVFFCPTCFKAKMISVIEPGREVSPEITAEWIDMILSGHAVRTMPIEEARLAEMCYTDHETEKS